ncbi:MAG TPA: NAD(+)/NADH kinase [Acidimicrobiales bacterium]|jgi:NAD+ kinase|nr:NAD(+)/NADH kinase [Acidimicrobiales bacterium]
MATIGFFPHPNRDEAIQLATATASWLKAEGHDAPIICDAVDGAVAPESHRQVAASLDVAVSLGGDGTMIRTVDLVAPLQVPVLGVNVGHLGFLTEVVPDDLRQALKNFLAGEYRIEARMTLAVEVRRHGDSGPPVRMTALNDAVLQRTSSGHTVRVAVTLSGTPFLTYAADSMIIATPTGSTAYNLSARGPIVAPHTRVVVMTPVAAHMLFDRSLVLADDEDINLEVLGDLPAELVVDGQSLGCLAAGDVVLCRAGDHDALFVDFGGRDFHHVLKQKFGLADR